MEFQAPRVLDSLFFYAVGGSGLQFCISSWHFGEGFVTIATLFNTAEQL